jgi:hypothetical protein
MDVFFLPLGHLQDFEIFYGNLVHWRALCQQKENLNKQSGFDISYYLHSRLTSSFSFRLFIWSMIFSPG